jgi:5-methylcytosine-specific restriction protein B
MSDSSDDDYSLEQAKEDIGILRRVESETVEAIEKTEEEAVIEYLIEEQQLDIAHEGKRGLGNVRRAVLESNAASDKIKRLVSLRGDETPEVPLVTGAELALRRPSSVIGVGRPCQKRIQ